MLGVAALLGGCLVAVRVGVLVVVALLGGCLAVRVGVVVVVAAVGGSLGTSSLTTFMAVLAADS